MEVNSPKFNQRRTSLIRFLGELYNYRIVDSALIFKVRKWRPDSIPDELT